MTSIAHRAGAPLGNTNALKHGFYSRAFRAVEQSALAALADAASLENEIQLMRVFILRVAQRETDDLSFTESLALLNVLSRAALSLGSLLRTQRTAANGNLHTQLEKLFAAGRSEFARANALVERLNRRLAELEAAAASTTSEPEPPSAAEEDESDIEYCDPPLDCLTCSDIADCPDVRPSIRDLILSLKLWRLAASAPPWGVDIPAGGRRSLAPAPRAGVDGPAGGRCATGFFRRFDAPLGGRCTNRYSPRLTARSFYRRTARCFCRRATGSFRRSLAPAPTPSPCSWGRAGVDAPSPFRRPLGGLGGRRLAAPKSASP